MTPTAAHLMSKVVVAARPDMTLEELAGLLAENRIHGAPVVDAHGRPVGLVSATDLLRRMRAEAEGAGQEPGEWYRRNAEGGEILPPDASWLGEIPDARVDDIMSRTVLTVDADAPITEIARQMTETGVHRLLVTRGERVVGIVSTMDLVRGISDHWPRPKG